MFMVFWFCNEVSYGRAGRRIVYSRLYFQGSGFAHRACFVWVQLPVKPVDAFLAFPDKYQYTYQYQQQQRPYPDSIFGFGFQNPVRFEGKLPVSSTPFQKRGAAKRLQVANAGWWQV
jgi:hypothetical protein